MQFLVSGILKPQSDQQILALRAEFNEHLSQPGIVLAGALHDRGGARIGYLAFIEAKNFEDAERYLQQNPFYQNGLYQTAEVAEFNAEVGYLE